MVYRFDQKPGAIKTTNVPPTADVGWVLNGVYDESSARAIAGTLLPPALACNAGVIYLKDIELDGRGHQLWDVTAKYAQSQITNGSVRFSFSTTGGQFHVDAAPFGNVAKYAASGTATDFKGLINADDSDGTLKVEGADIVIPQLKMTCAVKWPTGTVSQAYIGILESCTGCVNSTTFMGRPAGAVLFLGAEGEQGTDVETTLTYHFAVERNLTGLTYGDITGVNKDGHDLLWVRSQNYTDTNGKPGRKPIGVYVERIYERKNLAALLGFGG